MAKRILLLPRSFRLVRAEFPLPGEEKDSPASLAYFGEGESLHYFFSLLKVSPQPEVSHCPLYGLYSQIRKVAAGRQILVIEVNRLLKGLLPSGGLISYPWVRQRAFLNHPFFRSRRQGIENSYGRKVRQHQYEPRQTRDPVELERFYHHYYLPHMQARFGALAHPRSLSDLRRALRSGFLLQILRKGKWVAGAVCGCLPGSVQALAFGLDWSDQQEWNHGALSAVYYFLFDWAEKNDIPIVDLLRSRANRADGVFIHKSRWGALPERDPWPHTLLRFYFSPSMALPALFKTQLVWQAGKFLPMVELLEPRKEEAIES